MLSLHFFLVKPAGGYCLCFGVETEAVFAKAMKIAEEGLLVTREREDADGNGNSDINADHTAVGSLCKFSCVISALGKDNGAVCKRIVIHYLYAFLKVLNSLNAENGSEDFSCADCHILGYMVKDCGADIEAVFIAGNNGISAVENKLCALLYAFFNPFEN